jgi:hypothetical protein
MTSINFEKQIPGRECGGCTLCCKLVPTAEVDKPANQRCKHQRRTGCNIYARRPVSCELWSCQWLLGNDTADLRRPDRSRYVIDMMPDYVTLVHDDTGERQPIEVVQIWCDPLARNAWKNDPALLDYIERRGAEGKAAIIRFAQADAVTVFPPGMSEDRQWHFIEHGIRDPKPHDFLEVARVLSGQSPR